MKYCKKCGAENKDDAEYCIKCGNKLGKENHKGAEEGKNRRGMLPVTLLVVAVLAIGTVKLYPVFLEKDAEVSEPLEQDAAPVSDISQTVEEAVEPVSADDSKTSVTSASTGNNETLKTGSASAAASSNEYTATGSWHDFTISSDITVNTILKYDGNAIFNFNETVAVGVHGKRDTLSTTETESGFILSVIDDDSAKVSFYNNGTDHIVPVLLTAEMSATDYSDETGATEYIISGYSDCANGFGLIQMELSNGRTVKAGILRENGQLYAANFTTKPAIAENNRDFRLKMDAVLAESNIKPDNSTYTDPIYYPIVPVGQGEKTDVEFWVNKSNEIVEPDWTDAHKVTAFYEYIIDNMAYDNWVLSEGAKSRAFYHKDFTGTYFTSRTNVGICEDFANILAIMCRAQGIPATKIYTGEHAWTHVYIADYGRWMSVDVTNDLRYSCYSEDPANWTVKSSNSRYVSLDNIVASAFTKNCHAGIGNDRDMARYDIIPVELQ